MKDFITEAVNNILNTISTTDIIVRSIISEEEYPIDKVLEASTHYDMFSIKTYIYYDYDIYEDEKALEELNFLHTLNIGVFTDGKNFYSYNDMTSLLNKSSKKDAVVEICIFDKSTNDIRHAKKVIFMLYKLSAQEQLRADEANNTFSLSNVEGFIA